MKQIPLFFIMVDNFVIAQATNIYKGKETILENPRVHVIGELQLNLLSCIYLNGYVDSRRYVFKKYTDSTSAINIRKIWEYNNEQSSSNILSSD